MIFFLDDLTIEYSKSALTRGVELVSTYIWYENIPLLKNINTLFKLSKNILILFLPKAFGKGAGIPEIFFIL